MLRFRSVSALEAKQILWNLVFSNHQPIQHTAFSDDFGKQNKNCASSFFLSLFLHKHKIEYFQLIKEEKKIQFGICSYR